MVTPLRVLFMGTPDFAVPTLRALLSSTHTVCGVVTQPDRPRGRGHRVTAGPVKALALESGVPVFQPERLRDPAVEATLRSWTPDLGVVAAYGKLIPESLLALPRLGMINVHASLLPRHRGAAPVHRAVIAGDAVTGVTIMRVVKALDAGAMLDTVTRPIGPDDRSDDVERDLADLGARLLVTVVDRLAQGPVEEVAQDEQRATYAHRLTKEEGLVDWTLPAEAIHNRVRGLWPWPHAFTFLGAQRVILLRTRRGAASTTAPAGAIVHVERDGVEVATGQGTLLIEEVQPEGRRAMSARDFMAGHRLVVGQAFSGGAGSSDRPPHP
jgi:methionyl-tRNA formyltransferase